MANTKHQPNGTPANLPNKPAPARLSMSPHQTLPPQHQELQPVHHPWYGDEFRPSKTFSVVKLILRGINTILAIIVVGISAWLYEEEGFFFLGPILALILACLSLAWQIAEFITIASRRSIFRPIHAGAHIGVHLVLWLLGVIATVICTIELIYAFEIHSSYSGDMMTALLVFTLLMTLIHFVLFEMACVETDRRRGNGPQNRPMYLMATPRALVDEEVYHPQNGHANAGGHRQSSLPASTRSTERKKPRATDAAPWSATAFA